MAENRSQLKEALDKSRGSGHDKSSQHTHATLNSLLRSRVRTEECTEHNAAIAAAGIEGLRHGNTSKVCASAELLGLHLISLPESEHKEGLLKALGPALLRTATSGNKEVRAVAVEAYAMAGFLCAWSERAVLEIMNQLLELWSTGSTAGASVAAVRGWCLMYGRLEGTISAGRAAGEALEHLLTMQASSKQQLQDVAGEALALLFACHPQIQQQCEEGAPFSKASLEEGGEALPPPDNEALEALHGSVRLAAMKRMLASGFQVHLQHNPLLKMLPDAEPEPAGRQRLGKYWKRHVRSPNSRTSCRRTADRASARLHKHDAVHDLEAY